MAGLEARVVISADDRTGKAFDSVEARIARLTKSISVMDRAIGSVGQVSKNVEAMSVPLSRVSDGMGKITSAVGNVDRASAALQATMARNSAAVLRLGADMTTAAGKLKAVDQFKAAQKSMSEASLAMKKGQQDARRLAAELDAAGKPSNSMRAAFTSAETSASRLAAEFKVEAGAAAAARVALEEMGIPVNRLKAEEEGLRGTIERTTAAIRQQAQVEHKSFEATAADTRRHAELTARFARDERAVRQTAPAHGGGHSFGQFVAQNVALGLGAGEMINVGREAWARGAEVQHETIGLANAGRTPEEIAKIQAAGRSIVGAQPTASYVDILKTIAETTPAFGTVEHAINAAGFMTKAMSVLKASGGEHIHGTVGDVGRDLAKTFEERQINPDDFERQASMMIPAMVASGGTFNPTELYAFAQQAKSSLPSLSDHFLSRIAPSLIGAQGGQRAGTALNAFENVISGKANDKKQAQEWMSLGLLDPSMTITKNGQATSWKSGAVKGTLLAMSDPLAWAEQYLIPAMKAKGMDTSNRAAVKMTLDTMFRNQNSNLFASEIAQEASRNRLHKDEALYNQVGTLDEIYDRNSADFGVAAGALKTALGNLGAAATAPLMHNTAHALTALAGELNKFAVMGLDHPMMAGGLGIAAGAGALYGAGRFAFALNRGFGLGSSAKALDAAAAHLMEVGGGGGLAGKAGSAGAGAATTLGGEGGAAALAIPEVASAAAAAMGILGAAAVTQLVKSSFEAQQAGKGGQWSAPTTATQDLDRQRLDDQKAEATDLENQIQRNKVRSRLPEAAAMLNGPLEDQLATKRGQIALLEERLGGLAAYHDRETERGRGFMGLRSPEMFGPNLPAGPIRNEASGPFMPHPDDDRATRARAGDAFRFFPGAGSAAHDPWLDDRAGIEHRSSLAADHFRHDPEGARGDAMLSNFGSGLDEAKTKLDALGQPVVPHIDTGSLQAWIALANQALSLQGRLGGSPGAGTTGSTGPSRVVADPGVGRSR